MKQNIAVIGAKGNMGLRYLRILDSIPAVSPIAVDVGEWSALDGFTLDGAIVATPTGSHLKVINDLMELNPDIHLLCEKPISTHLEFVKEAFNTCKNLRMVNQYKSAVEITDLSPTPDTHTYYDYFRTGSDGLYWDCINIIGMADNTVTIANNSPIWRCAINGQPLNLGDIDAGYLWDVSDWVAHGGSNDDYAIEAHERVLWLQGA